MSQENVELIRGLQPAPDVDVAALFRDRAAWAALMETVAPPMHEDFNAGVRTGFDADSRSASSAISPALSSRICGEGAASPAPGGGCLLPSMPVTSAVLIDSMLAPRQTPRPRANLVPVLS